MPAEHPVGSPNFIGIVERLLNHIRTETTSIRQGNKFDFKNSVERKSRLLFELNRASRAVDINTLDNQCLAQLAQLKTALQENETQLAAHLSAVREVSGIMVQLLKNEEADGTYCAQM